MDENSDPAGGNTAQKTRSAPVRLAEDRLALDRFVPSRTAEDRLAFDKSAPLRLLSLTSASGQGLVSGTEQSMNDTPARFAKLRSTPDRFAPARSTPGQFVKFVEVGLETIVQPLTTVSAEAGVAVAKTGVTKATTITRAEVPTRRRRPNMALPQTNDGPVIVGRSCGSCPRRKRVSFTRQDFLRNGSYPAVGGTPQARGCPDRAFTSARTIGEFHHPGSVQFLTVMLTPELNSFPAELEASDTRTYELSGTVVVFQAHNHPYSVAVAVQIPGAADSRSCRRRAGI